MARRQVEARCSFCGKTREQVRRLVAGPGVFICDDCVRLCYEVLNEEPPRPASQSPGDWIQSTRSTRPKGWGPLRWVRGLLKLTPSRGVPAAT